MKAGLSFASIRIDGALICDGHHRYIASLLAGHDIATIPSCSTSAIKVFDWKNVVFESEDHESADEIGRLDQKDADFNQITLEELYTLVH